MTSTSVYSNLDPTGSNQNGSAVINATSSTHQTAIQMPACAHYDHIIQMWFHFDTLHLVRVLITWVLFALSMTGNTFVIWSLRRSRARHFIMFHLALSDLVYTLFVMPSDAIWNTTMQWIAGDFMCRVCQMMKQFAMYASSFMVAVIGMDRVTGILSPLPCESQRKRGFVMVTVAWVTSLVCCIPAGVIFSVFDVPNCENKGLYQCVDFQVVKDRSLLPPYYLFTMLMSFVLPLLCTLISYSLIVCEISNMKARDRVLMGRRNSVNTASMRRAKQKTILMRTLVTLTFLICWGPYYGKGIYDWFRPTDHTPPVAVDTAMYIAMYLNPVLHPIVFGIFMKEIRDNFFRQLQCFRKIFIKPGPRRMSSVSRASYSSYATASTQVHFAVSRRNSNNNAYRLPHLNSATKQLLGSKQSNFQVATDSSLTNPAVAVGRL